MIPSILKAPKYNVSTLLLQMPLARWLDARARHMEISEKVRQSLTANQNASLVFSPATIYLFTDFKIFIYIVTKVPPMLSQHNIIFMMILIFMVTFIIHYCELSHCYS